MNFDMSKIYVRPDGSYLLNQGLYHVPNDGEWAELWEQVDAYAKEHPEVVENEPTPPEPTFEEQVEAAYAALDANVEKRLNDFAATRRYASIYTACNARDSHSSLNSLYLPSRPDRSPRGSGQQGRCRRASYIQPELRLHKRLQGQL